MRKEAYSTPKRKRDLIVLAGATGDLGSRIAAEAVSLGAEVRALVRSSTPTHMLDQLSSPGIERVVVDFSDVSSLSKACEGGTVAVSALSGLDSVILGAQKNFLIAGVKSGVPRFIPSDFAIDYTRLQKGSNRNLDLRRDFQVSIEAQPIRVTSILNGAFSDMLTGVAPFILYRYRRILCWGSPLQLMDWTTISDTARFTAHAAMDPETPRWLRIAGDQVNAQDLAKIMSEVTGNKHRILKPGGIRLLGTMISMTKACTPSSDDLYPAWQGMQYMRDLYSGLAKFRLLDNDRYSMDWTSVRQVLANYLHKN